MKKAFLGIDTSNYTTSACIISGHDFVSYKIPLFVKVGERGVRQSEAVFQHIKNMPSLFENVFVLAREKFGNDVQILSVGVSDKPRRVEGSYMPCFLAGVSSASSVSSAFNVPLYSFSHQEGHVRAAIFGSGSDSGLSHFFSFHLSGGTCELLKVQKDRFGYQTEIVCDSEDITLGQLLDRTGVLMGMQFPCGAELDSIAKSVGALPKVSIKKGERINLSGFENKVSSMLEKGATREEIASFVFGVCVSAVSVMLAARDDTSLPVVFSGGVCSSEVLRENVKTFCDARFAPSVFSADNAIGIASLTQEKFLSR